MYSCRVHPWWWPAIWRSNYSGSQAFHSAARFSDGSQSSNRTSGSSPVKASTGRALPHLLTTLTGARRVWSEAWVAAPPSAGVAAHELLPAKARCSASILSSFWARVESNSVNWEQLRRHKSFVRFFSPSNCVVKVLILLCDANTSSLAVCSARRSDWISAKSVSSPSWLPVKGSGELEGGRSSGGTAVRNAPLSSCKLTVLPDSSSDSTTWMFCGSRPRSRTALSIICLTSPAAAFAGRPTSLTSCLRNSQSSRNEGEGS